MSLDQLKNTDAEEADKGSKVCNVLLKESSNNCLHENIRSKHSTCGRAQELDMCNFDRIPVGQKDAPNPSAVQHSTLFQETSKTKEQRLDGTQRKPDSLTRKRKHIKDTMTKSKISKQNQVEDPMESSIAPTLDIMQDASFNLKGDLPSVMMDQNKSNGKSKLKITNPSLALDNLVSRCNRSDSSSKLVNSRTSAISTTSNKPLANSATAPNVPAAKQDVITKDVDEVNCVLHLEEAMNRHLPDSKKNGDADGFQCQSPLKKHRPAIQWISSHEPPQASLPASMLLRSLHANRESVIRTNVFTPQYYSEMQCSISTPANYKDPFGSSSLGYNRVSTPTNYETTDYISSRLSSTIDGYLVSTSFTSPCFSNSHYFEGGNGQHRYSAINTCNIPFKPQPYSLPIYPNCQLTSYESPSPPYAHSYYNSSLGLSAYNAVKSSKVYMSFDAD